MDMYMVDRVVEYQILYNWLKAKNPDIHWFTMNI